MSVLIGLDLGTSGVRAIAVDERGRIVAEGSAAYPLASPQPGWMEQDPEDWWQGTKTALAKVAGRLDQDVVGIGLAGQMHGSVFLDSSGAVIRPAPLWNDQRTAAQCDTITETVGAERLLAITGNPALTGFQAPKILWLRDREPERYRKVAHVLLPKDYIRFRLTGAFATDASDAAGTLLLDTGRRDWSDELLDLLELPREWFPDVCEGPEQAGTLRHDVAAEIGLQPGIPVAAGGGDNAAAAVGVGVISDGIVGSSIGTSGVVFAHTDEFRPDPTGRLHAFCHAIPGAWHLMGVTLSAGGSLAWWREVLHQDFDDLMAAAGTTSPGSEGLVFLPYLTGERTPHRDPLARGMFLGLTSRHEAAHMTRAVMEGVVYSLRDSLEVLRSLDVPVDQVRATGGGARGALWRQLQADIYNLPIYRTTIDEGPAFGAALLAGVASGVHTSVDEAVSLVELRPEVTEPDPERAKAYQDQYEVYRSLYEATAGAMHRLSSLAALSVEIYYT